MIPAGRYRYVGSSADAEGEALQTDVMRFMAILGLCLTAIFALVQSMSLLPADEARAQAMATDLQAAREQAEQAAARLARERQESGRLRQQISDLREQLVQTQQAAAAPEPAPIEVPAPEPVEPAEPEPMESAKLEPVDLPASGAVELVDPEPVAAAPEPVSESLPEAPVESPDAQPEAAAEAIEEADGFALRFASAEALKALLRRGQVQFFALRAGRVWRLDARGRGWAFATASAPAQMHDMEPATVPQELRRALLAVGSGQGSPVRWGVTLSPAMESALAAAMNGARGGELTIAADGRVGLGVGR